MQTRSLHSVPRALSCISRPFPAAQPVQAMAEAAVEALIDFDGVSPTS
jgi:hypothetical protein